VDEVVIHCLVDEVVIHCVSRKRKRKEEGKTKKSKIKWKKKNGIATKLAPPSKYSAKKLVRIELAFWPSLFCS
jgi:hypothetical protein